MRLISKMPTLAAIAYKTAIGMTLCTCMLGTACPVWSPAALAPHWQRICFAPSCLCSLFQPVLGLDNVNCFLTNFTYTGQPIVYPRNDLTYTENILHMMFSLPSERYQVDPVLSKALEVILILHMDHEQNASTSTVRVAGKPVTLSYLTMFLFQVAGGCVSVFSAMSRCQQWQEISVVCFSCVTS